MIIDHHWLQQRDKLPLQHYRHHQVWTATSHYCFLIKNGDDCISLLFRFYQRYNNRGQLITHRAVITHRWQILVANCNYTPSHLDRQHQHHCRLDSVPFFHLSQTTNIPLQKEFQRGTGVPRVNIPFTIWQTVWSSFQAELITYIHFPLLSGTDPVDKRSCLPPRSRKLSWRSDKIPRNLLMLRAHSSLSQPE